MVLKYVNGKTMKANPKSVLDQYFTKPSVAKYLYNLAYSKIKEIEKDNIKKYFWLEPCAGDGSFYNLLPKAKRIGIDIEPRIKGLIKSDYLKYKLPKKPLIVLGNPAFGHRGVLALEFINHSAGADYVCFILPMFFDSIGKGSIKYRVKGFNLIYSELVQENAFYIPNKRDINVRCVFQIWSSKHKSGSESFNWYNNSKNPFKKFVEVFTVSLAKKRECGKEWIFNKKANWYLSSTFHKTNKVVKDFKQVKYESGVCIVYKTKNKKYINKLNKIFLEADWNKYSSLATNSCRHIGKSHIYQLLLDNKVNTW